MRACLAFMFSVFSFGASLHANAQSLADTSTIYYTLEPIPNDTSTTLVVTLRYKADSIQKVQLLQDNYGTPDLYRYIKSFNGINGCIVDSIDQTTRMVSPNTDKEIHLRYTIAYDGKKLDDFAYAPAVGNSFFHVAGCQWMLPPAKRNVKRQWIFNLLNPYKGWHYYSSIDHNPFSFSKYANYNELLGTVIGGSKEGYYHFRFQKKPVYVYIQPGYNFSYTRVQKSIKTLIEVMRSWFKDNSQPFYHIPIMQRSGVIAGHSITNMFRCFVKPDVTEEELLLLMAHELFHSWLPNKMNLVPADGQYGIRTEWFTEGFTEYVSWKILLENKLITTDQFAQQVNRAIFNLIDNPYHQHSYEDLVKLAKAGKGGSALKKLSYYRGAIMALNWDHQIRKHSKDQLSINDFVRKLYQQAHTQKNAFSEEDLFAFTKQFGIDAHADFTNYIIKGEKVAALAPGFDRYKLTSVNYPAFDAGFIVDNIYQTKKITGVKEGSAAYKAGLREGMDFVNLKNGFRFSNAWRADQPLEVTVLVNDNEQTFRYFPHGAEQQIQAYTN